MPIALSRRVWHPPRRVPAVPLSAPCFAHPDRSGYAVCMTCQAVLCQECATTFDGINFCRPCLARRRDAGGPTVAWPRRLGHLATALALAAMLVACVHVMAWIATILAGFR
jgi:hypothetical protein